MRRTSWTVTGLVWTAFQASILAGYGLGWIAWEYPPPPAPAPTVTSTPTPTPRPSHRPGVVPWETCTAHPNPSCPSPPPTACPTKVPPGTEHLYPCRERK